MKSVFIYPGLVEVSNEHTQFRTILGSCVSVILFDVESGVSGMNHFLLPHVTHANIPTPRFGEIAIPTLIEKLKKLGALSSRLQAKVFGGGKIIEDITFGDRVGTLNVEFAFKALKELKIPVIAQDVLGNKHRKLIFDSNTYIVEVTS